VTLAVRQRDARRIIAAALARCKCRERWDGQTVRPSTHHEPCSRLVVWAATDDSEMSRA
jgi:hypothetical protein